ncbi:MAG: hypothetical protein J3Q66DRAFT_406325 [Benniella sp.]|nr:MAG: hypothetical protein J3Q66DRAFT_406325 [Benniella sp.]
MASNNGCYRIGEFDIMGSFILPISTIYPAFHLRETWRARGMDVVNDFETPNTIQPDDQDILFESTPKAPALRPRNTRTQRQVFQAAAGRPEMTKAIGTAFVKMAFGLSAFVRLPAGTAEALTTDRQQGHGPPSKGEEGIPQNRRGRPDRIDRRGPALSTYTRRLNPKSLTDMRIKYVDSHVLFEKVDAAEWARVSGVEGILDYQFKDRSLLVAALRPMGGSHADGVTTNDRLEYLGDSVLELVTALFWPLEGRRAIGTLKEQSVFGRAQVSRLRRQGRDMRQKSRAIPLVHTGNRSALTRNSPMSLIRGSLFGLWHGAVRDTISRLWTED